jgi:bifunctional oligoribonuclease and PAP phosphatase NrnA
MTVKRAERVAPAIFEEISKLLITKLEDPRLKGITLTKVKMTPDLRIARVYFSLIGEPAQIDAAGEAFTSARRIIRRAIGDAIKLRYLPDLEFFYDPNPAYADKIDNLIREIHHQQRGEIEQALAFIAQYDSFVISAHQNPEGDAIGATLGLGAILRKIGKTAQPFNPDPVPLMCAFMPGAKTILHAVADIPPVEAVIVVDCGDPDRTGPEFKAYLKDKPVLNIDHHDTNTAFGSANWVEPQASSTGEMIVTLAGELGAKILPEPALCLYTAILTDTGSFQFSNTSARTLEAAAELVAAGADPERAATYYYHRKSAGYLMLMADFLATLQFNPGATVGEAVLTRQNYERAQAGPDASENFINLILDVASVKIAVFFRERGDDEWKVSFRAKGQADIARIAVSFGGGGHPNAAGCTIKGTLEEVQKRVRETVEAALVP